MWRASLTQPPADRLLDLSVRMRDGRHVRLGVDGEAFRSKVCQTNAICLVGELQRQVQSWLYCEKRSGKTSEIRAASSRRWSAVVSSLAVPNGAGLLSGIRSPRGMAYNFPASHCRNQS